MPLAEAPWAVDEEEPHPSDFETRLYRARNIHVIGVSGAALADQTAAVLRGLEE